MWFCDRCSTGNADGEKRCSKCHVLQEGERDDGKWLPSSYSLPSADADEAFGFGERSPCPWCYVDLRHATGPLAETLRTVHSKIPQEWCYKNRRSSLRITFPTKPSDRSVAGIQRLVIDVLREPFTISAAGASVEDVMSIKVREVCALVASVRSRVLDAAELRRKDRGTKRKRGLTKSADVAPPIKVVVAKVNAAYRERIHKIMAEFKDELEHATATVNTLRFLDERRQVTQIQISQAPTPPTQLPTQHTTLRTHTNITANKEDVSRPTSRSKTSSSQSRPAPTTNDQSHPSRPPKRMKKSPPTDAEIGTRIYEFARNKTNEYRVIYPNVYSHEADVAGKVTGMLMKLDEQSKRNMYFAKSKLQNQVEHALQTLRQFYLDAG